jgi:mannosyltransferase
MENGGRIVRATGYTAPAPNAACPFLPTTCCQELRTLVIDLRRGSFLLLLASILLGAALRFWRIDAKTIWLDEAFSIWLAHHNLPDLWAWLIRIDQHPPLYYTLLHIWQAFFGDLQGAVRALSALCSALTLPVFYLAVHRFCNAPTALIATLLLAVSPIHVRYAQEARMYALLTLAVAMALLCLAHILTTEGRLPPRWAWRGLSLAQAAILWTHNTATVFFPLALNLAIGGALAWRAWRGGVSTWPALNQRGFARQWLRAQVLALILWLPWSIPFVIQAVMVDRGFWIQPPTFATVLEFLHNSNVAFLPPWIPLAPLWHGLYWLLMLVGLIGLRQQPARALTFLALWLTPIIGELLVSLRRPIFSERTLLWTTLPYLLLVAVGVRRLEMVQFQRWSGRHVQILLLSLLITLRGTGLFTYYGYFEKEDWAKAAAYVAEQVQPGELILFNASWVQLPFDYYFRHYGADAELRGLPVDLFARGELEPAMTEADLPHLHTLVAGRDRLWLIYSHNWYTDPDGLIPRELDRLMRRTDHQEFREVEVMRFEAR